MRSRGAIADGGTTAAPIDSAPSAADACGQCESRVLSVPGWQASIMEIRYLQPDGLVRSPAFSHGAVIPPGATTIYIGGQNSVDETGKVASQDAAAQAARAIDIPPGATTIYIGGQNSVDETGKVASQDAAAQAARAIDNAETVLRAAGAMLADVV